MIVTLCAGTLALLLAVRIVSSAVLRIVEVCSAR